MKLIYPAIFHKENDSVWVEFPDLPGCHSCGDAIKDALENAQEALEGYAIVLLEDGKALPEPSDITGMAAPDDGFVSLVETDLSGYLLRSKAVKKTLTIPSWLNDQATSKGINFSAVLQDALVHACGLM